MIKMPSRGKKPISQKLKKMEIKREIYPYIKPIYDYHLKKEKEKLKKKEKQ